MEMSKKQKVDKSFIDYCKEGNLEKVNQLLLNNVDPSEYNNSAFRWACNNGHLDIVKVLIADSRVDPSDCDDDAIDLACKNGHLEIVKVLLNDKRVLNIRNTEEQCVRLCVYM